MVDSDVFQKPEDVNEFAAMLAEAKAKEQAEQADKK